MLERRGELRRIGVEVDPRLEMTEICDRVLKAQGPALLFEKPRGHSMPVLGNLFGTPLRRSAARRRAIAGFAQGAGAAAQFEGRVGQAAVAQTDFQHVACGGLDGRLPGGRLGRRCR